MAHYFRRRLARREQGPEEQADLVRQLAKFGENVTIQRLLATTVSGTGSTESRLRALRAMAGSALKETPSVWVDGLAAVMSGGDAILIREAVASLRALPDPGRKTPGT